MLKFDLFSVNVPNVTMGQLFNKSASDLYFSVTAQKIKGKTRSVIKLLPPRLWAGQLFLKALFPLRVGKKTIFPRKFLQIAFKF